MQFIENATSGSQNIIISQGSGANVTIPAGDVKAVYLDGAGSGAAVTDAFASLNVVDLKVQDDLTVTDDVTIGGTLGVTGVLTGTSLDISGDIDVDGTTNLDVVDIDGAVDMASTLQVDGSITSSAEMTLTRSDNGINLSLVSTDADANEGPGFVLYRNSSSPADGDVLGQIYFQGENDADQKVSFAYQEARIVDASDGTEDGRLETNIVLAGTAVSRVLMDATETVFNDNSKDLDFRVESDNDANAFFLQGNTGNIALGHNAPDSILHIKDAADTYVTLEAGSSDGNVGHIFHDNGGSQNGYTLYDTDDDIYYINVNSINRVTIRSGNHFEFRGPDANSNQFKMMDSSGNIDGYLYAEAEEIGFLDADGNWAMQVKKDNYVRFLVNNSETMRVAGAQVLIGITSAHDGNFKLGGIATSTVSFLSTQNNATSGTMSVASFRANSNSEIGSIQTSNTATSFNTSSDYRLKENIQPLENGLERLNNLKPVKFNWKDDGTSSEGFIAHETQEVFPDAVSGEKDGEKMQGMDYGRITPLLVKAIQEQQEQIEQLKAEIKTLQ
jgi:hypothetical protein